MPKQKQPHRQKDEKKICGATAKSTGEPCKLPAGFGTDHVGEGRCKYHGGLSKGPGKKNKNAVKTHEHETIWLDTLDDDEKNLYDSIRTDVASQLKNEIKLTDIRIRRMMQRIKKLKKEEFTTVERKNKNGMGPEGPVNITETKDQATLGQIQNIEDAITRVQSRKTKLLKLKHQVENNQGPIDVDVSHYINAISNAAEEVWDNEQG